MMRGLNNLKIRVKSMSRRTLSMILIVCILLSMVMVALSGFVMVTDAINPTMSDGLNHLAVVQEINLLPAANVTGDATNNDRTYLNTSSASKDTYKYADVTVNADESVDFTITSDTTINQNTNNYDYPINDTSYVEAFTKINQRFNPAENPWLTVRWSGSGRCNGRIYFTVTKGGVEYGRNNAVIADDYETTDVQSMITGGKLFAVSLSNVINNKSAGYEYTNHTQTDFNAGTVADYTIDFYKYLMENKASFSLDNWPSGTDWADSKNNYITIYLACQIMASESNKPLTTGTSIHWEKFAIGREVMDRPASILPRSAEFMNITNVPAAGAEAVGVDYGRVSKLDDGSVTFRNTGTEPVRFTWNMRSYFNATELEELLVSATYTGMTSSDLDLKAWYGGRTTTYIEPGAYNYRGTYQSLNALVNGGYARTNNITPNTQIGGTYEAAIDFHAYLMWVQDQLYNEVGTGYTGDYRYFFPDDSLIFVGDVQLTLPAGAKITFTRLEFQVENAQIPATQSNTVYPWASETSPNGLPPEGTAALSTALNGSSGTSYDWAASAQNAPVVSTKVDLLALKTYQFCEWDMDAISTSEDDGIGVDYKRLSTGESLYSSKSQTDYTFYRLMRYGVSKEYTRNYYLYFNTTRTPYFYYSYKLIDTTPDDGVAPSAGFYFHFANAGRDTYVDSQGNTKDCYLYYLDQTGIALRECNSFYSSDSYRYVAEAILSPAQARTGCVDISSLYNSAKAATGENNEYLKFEEMRVYLAPGTDIQINYMFVGSGSLAESAVGTIATQGGEAYPWAVTKEAFDAQTDPDSSTSTISFANKVDVLADLKDRAIVNGSTTIPGGSLNESNGALTVTVTNRDDVNSGYLKSAGVSFDHQWRVQVPAEGDLSSVRYLNYSVDAPSGMRWSLLISEHGSDSTPERAILTWADAEARYNDDNVYTAAPAGLSLFRYVDTGKDADGNQKEYDAYWSGHNNTSWRIYSIPGSQTGCVDLKQVCSTFDWSNIVSIYLIAYQDPNMELSDNQAASVTFNYLYLTSEPIAKNDVGKPATTVGTVHSWGGAKVTAPTVPTATSRDFTLRTQDYWHADYVLSDIEVDLSTTPYLYYSYHLVDKATGKTVTTVTDANGATKTVPLRVGMSIFHNGQYYYFRNTAGADSSSATTLASAGGAYRGYGKAAFVRRSTNDSNNSDQFYTKDYYVYGSETACIDLRGYFADITGTHYLNNVRFYFDSEVYDSTKHELIVDYLFLGEAATSATTFTKTYMPAFTSGPAAADHQVDLGVAGMTLAAGTTNYQNAIKIDLSKTPYLYYSLQYASGAMGTFGLAAVDEARSNAYPFFRDAGRVDGVLISGGTSPTTGQYMLQSETGCIDVRAWFRSQGYTGDIIYINSLTLWGSNATVKYMYFGAAADKTIDLIPSKASGTLDSGSATTAWVMKSGGYGEVVASDGDWDVYDTNTVYASTPETQLKFTDDSVGDGFNNLRIKSTIWSQAAICYGNIVNKGSLNEFKNYVSTGNNQMSGLTIDLNETPYLHYSLEQSDTSVTTMLLQTNDFMPTTQLIGETADKVRPWLSAYCPTSPAGQLIQILGNTNTISYYKDTVIENPSVKVSGNSGGVIDLRSWYTVTNGYDNVISLERIRFYTYVDGVGTELKINHLYLSSSASAAYSVTFNKNDGTNTAYTQYVLKNANEQYVSDAAVSHFKERDGYTFVGWYSDPTCETYFDIQGTPLTGNVVLYARWIKNSDILDGKEVNILANLDFSNRVVLEGYGEADFDAEKLVLNNPSTSTALKVKFPVGKAYSVEAMRSLFVGFDTDLTSKGFDIIIDAKCTSSNEYSLIQDAFAADFLTDAKLLTAAPYDRELALYTYLGVRDDLPTRENEKGLIEINSITIVIPAGVSAEFRYIKAGNEMAMQGNTDSRAPAATDSFDLLDNVSNDAAFVTKSDNVVYSTLEAKSVTYLSKEYTQSAIHGIASGYAHLGGLYTYTIDMQQIAAGVSQKGRYLYFSIDQPDDSYFTFALYASFSGNVEGEKANVLDKTVYDIYTKKSVSYYSAAANGLVAKEYTEASEGFIPVETAYINGNLVGKIDLYTWYSDALVPYRSHSEVTSVEILGLRLYTGDKSTDATINYMFIGNDETDESKGTFEIFAEYPYLAGRNTNTNYTEYRHVLSAGAKRGETIYVSLDQLTNLKDDAPIDDPTKVFAGWVFRDIVYWQRPEAERENMMTGEQLANYLVYWNPDATNGNMYDPNTNPGGSWSKTPVSGFVTNMKSVFYTFSTMNGNTQVIVPVFLSKWDESTPDNTTDLTYSQYQPRLSVTIEGSGSVSVITGNATPAGTNAWTTAYASELVIRASSDESAFVGWYDTNGALVSTSAACHLSMVADTQLIAKFGTADTSADSELEYLPQSGNTIVWLQSTTGVAGTDFYLKSVNSGDISLQKLSFSNINDTTGKSQIACYWNVADSQMVTAVAPTEYHWEQLFADGTSLRVSAGNEYTFIASSNVKLVCIADGNAAFETTVMIDEVAFDDDRNDSILRFNGQVICAEGEEYLSCGLAFIDYANHGEVPSIDCAASSTVTASAWNAATGQFVVEFSIADAPEYAVRGYAIVRNTNTGEIYVRYSQCMATVF